MYPIDTGCKTINGERVDTFIRSIIGKESLMEVEAGTNARSNTYRFSSKSRISLENDDQGDRKRVYIRLTVLNKADFFARVKTNEAGQPVAVELCFGGKDGVEAAQKALDFVLEVLRDQLSGFNE